ncbi:MAG TPA: hypothetical protein VLM85_15735 [Polyangiaceae bacterium]|nr:hypothetical protein [Polyangiaceae bacterium]
MRWIVLLVVLGSGACDASGPAGDGGYDSSDECTGTPFLCCTACDDDTPSKAICVGGTYACPSGTHPRSSFSCPCYAFACSLPPPMPVCVTCADGGHVASTCHVDAGAFECPAGSYNLYGSDDAGAICGPMDAGGDL